MRPFLWHNYGGPEEDKFQLSLRYTSYQSIEPLANATDLFKTITFQNMELIRQRNIREAMKKKATVTTSNSDQDVDILVNNYKDMLSDDATCYLTTNVSESKASYLHSFVKAKVVCIA